jgi:hypothetical protein
MSMHGGDVWAFAGNAIPDLTGFKVEARDGAIGKVDVDAATIEGSPGYLVVDTGPWIFGKKVLLPAGVLRGVDADTETAYVDLTKDEIKNAPEFDEARRAGEHQNDRFSRDHDS